MGNCIKSKFNGNYNNNTIPVFSKIVFNLVQSQDPRWLLVRAGSNSCTVELVNTSLSSRPGETTITVPAGQNLSGNLDVTQANAKVIVDAYNFYAIQVEASDNLIGFDSAFYGDLIWLDDFDYFPMNSVFAKATKLKGFNGAWRQRYTEEEYLHLCENNKNLVVLQNITGMTAPLTNDRQWKDVMPLNGNLADFPTTLSRLYISASVTGSITDFVNNMVSAGRTSGKIIASWLGGNNNITINDNGVEVGAKTYFDSHGISSGGMNVALSWDANGYTVSNDTTGAEPIPAITNINNY